MTEHALSGGHTAKGRLQRACLALLRQHDADGTLPTSARFVYYELKQAGYPLPRHARRRPDQDVIDAIMTLRAAGAVPWDWLADETRSIDAGHVAPTLAQWTADLLDRARINPWDGPRPLIICESRGVRAALRDTAWQYAARITSTNGQAGGFLRTDLAPVAEAKTPVAYVGDWNPAGSAIEANTRRVLERAAGCALGWERLAITPGQAAAASPPLPPKPGTDRRYADGRPHDSYEAEALGQRALIALAAGWLDGLLPQPLHRVLERERAQRHQLRLLLERNGLI